MPSERLGLRAWLEHNLNNKKYRGVKWIDRTNGTFSISWKHASRHGWDEDEDAAIFKEWAIHTGRYRLNYDTPNPKTWKANFRCAMNASRDIKTVKDQSLKGKNACRIFEFSKNRKSRIKVSTRNVTTRLEKLNIRSRNYLEERKRNIRLAARRHKFVNVKHVMKMEEPEEVAGSVRDATQQRCSAVIKDEEEICINEEKCSQTVCEETPQYLQQLPPGTDKQTCSSVLKSENNYSPSPGQQMQVSETFCQKLDTGYFSFAELLEKIPRDNIPNYPRVLSSPTFENLPVSIDDDVVKDLLRYVEPGESKRCDEESCYYGQSYTSTPDTSDAEDIAEMFDEGTHIHATIKELENILKPQSDYSDYEFIPSILNESQLPPLSSINAPFFPAMFTPVISDRFLGEDYERSDNMTRSLKTSFVYELQ